MGGEAPQAAMRPSRSLVREFAQFVAILACVLMVSGCSSSHPDRIVIGSKNFTESLILGEMMAQQIDTHTHLKVERRFYLAGTYICQQGMLSGRIDVYPEYTGTAFTAIPKEKTEGEALTDLEMVIS